MMLEIPKISIPAPQALSILRSPSSSIPQIPSARKFPPIPAAPGPRPPRERGDGGSGVGDDMGKAALNAALRHLSHAALILRRGACKEGKLWRNVRREFIEYQRKGFITEGFGAHSSHPRYIVLFQPHATPRQGMRFGCFFIWRRNVDCFRTSEG